MEKEEEGRQKFDMEITQRRGVKLRMAVCLVSLSSPGSDFVTCVVSPSTNKHGDHLLSEFFPRLRDTHNSFALIHGQPGKDACPSVCGRFLSLRTVVLFLPRSSTYFAGC